MGNDKVEELFMVEEFIGGQWVKHSVHDSRAVAERVPEERFGYLRPDVRVVRFVREPGPTPTKSVAEAAKAVEAAERAVVCAMDRVTKALSK